MFYAHTKPGADKEDWQLLEEHLNEVSRIASEFTDVFGASDWGLIAGKFHDHGKYKPDFQNKLIRQSSTQVDHKSVGARLLLDNLGAAGHILSYCIAGHHGGLPDFANSVYGESFTKILSKADNYLNVVPKFENNLSAPDFPFKLLSKFQISFFTRMIFSALVDADFLDTERFMDRAKFELRDSGPSLRVLLDALDSKLGKFTPNGRINSLRCEILEHCRRSAAFDRGLFTLTVPTGGGKTLTSMAFALEHAIRHGMRRIIYVIPFTSIIEQNAKVFKDIFPDGSVVEHHSNFDDSKIRDEEDIPGKALRHRLACENWDAPVVVTTNVQFFESLFAAKSSRCRKLHNLAGAVIILDEAQMLPVEYLNPCMRALEELVENYNSSVVLCTATQPALDKSFEFENGLKISHEIAPDPIRIHQKFQRTELHQAGIQSLEDITVMIREREQVLCIVNTRARAGDLFSKINNEKGACHLSALMCPAHRTKALKSIRDRLKDQKPCRVVSTQLIEAGVNVSFPEVIREIAGLDSIAQAAGRCNREGELEKLGKLGKVTVFEPKEGVVKAFSQAAGSTKNTLRHHEKDPFSPASMKHFFAETYWLKKDVLDKKKILKKLESINGEWSFRDADYNFKLIDSEMLPVIVPYNDKAEKLISSLKFAEHQGAIQRKLQQFTVQIYKHQFSKLNNYGALEFVDETYAVLRDSDLYGEAGLMVPDDITDGNFIF